MIGEYDYYIFILQNHVCGITTGILTLIYVTFKDTFKIFFPKGIELRIAIGLAGIEGLNFARSSMHFQYFK